MEDEDFTVNNMGADKPLSAMSVEDKTPSYFCSSGLGFESILKPGTSSDVSRLANKISSLDISWTALIYFLSPTFGIVAVCAGEASFSIL